MKVLIASLLILILVFSISYWMSEPSEPNTPSEPAQSTSAESARPAQPEHAEGVAVHVKPEIVEDHAPKTVDPPEPSPPINKPIDPVPVVSGYYQAVNGLTGSDFKKGLHQIIRGHRALSYGELWEALRDIDRGDEGNVILIYDRTQRSHTKNGGDQGDWNREHLWPRGYGVRRSSSANTDLHHIRASDVGINGKRGHLYFDETDGDDFSGKRYSFDMDSWEPPNQVKGDIARALFYMAVRYEGAESGSVDLELSDEPDMKKGVHGKLSTLLTWHQNDPVSDHEKTRNNKIYRNYQGNRNPFIDHPEWVAKIFGKE